MKSERIHIKSYPAVSRTAKASLLFVHGGFVNSTCWEFNFIPFFQRHGYGCFTIDLSGHGGSDGRECLDRFGIEDYAEDLEYAIRKIGRPLVLIGHSMGSRVLEHFLEEGEAAAAIFMSPVPTTGTASSALQLALRHPAFVQAIDDVVSGKLSDQNAEMLARIYFSPDVPPAETLKYLPMIGPESRRAVAQMAVPKYGYPVNRCQLPALVVGGTADAVFPVSMLHFMSVAWNADIHRVKGAGHMLMLDPQWEEVAGHMLAWMEQKGFQSAKGMRARKKDLSCASARRKEFHQECDERLAARTR